MAEQQDHYVDKYPEGFSLIELLVVIFILSLLTGVLLPTILNAKILAKQVACSAQFSSLGKAASLYQGDYEGFIPVCIKNYSSSSPKPWKSWRMNLLPYVSGVGVFNCTAARDMGFGFEIIRSIEEMADTSGVGTMNLGSYGTIDHEPHDTYMTINNYGDMKEGDPAYSCAFPISPGVFWKNPDSSVYLADACLVRGEVEYPTQLPYKGAGTSCIIWPSRPDPPLYRSTTDNVRRFADRHKGTNCLFLDGHVDNYVTKVLDSMVDGNKDCVWDWK